MLGLIIAGFFFTCLGQAWGIEIDDDVYLYESIVSSVREIKEQHRLEEEGTLTIDDDRRPTSVCYDELGCFDNTTFKHITILPEPPETVNTKFLLYTRKNLMTPEFLDYRKPETIINSNINPNVGLKFITHGFGGKNNITWVWNMKNAFLEAEDVNVVLVDWTFGSRLPYYPQAAVNTVLIGAQIATMYFLIKDHFGIVEKDLHFVGFSLGAHVSGFAGKKMLDFRDTRPGRITGLDPAGLLFEDTGPDVHLYKDDADYVDVIHTNADEFYFGGLGIEKALGHVDYYPNGGKRQPGCSSTLMGFLNDMVGNKRAKVCNHERAVKLFTTSILADTPCEFEGFKCSSYEEFEKGNCMSCDEQCGVMGYKSRGSGIYYMMTGSAEPYCVRHAKLRVKFAPKVKETYGSFILTLTTESGKTKNITVTKKDDQKLSPGEEIVKVISHTERFKKVEHMQVFYKKYRGILTRGAKTFGLESVTIESSDGSYIFKACMDPPVTLKDLEYHTLNESESNC